MCNVWKLKKIAVAVIAKSKFYWKMTTALHIDTFVFYNIGTFFVIIIKFSLRIFPLFLIFTAGLGLVTTVIPRFWVQCLSALLFIIFGLKMLREGE